MNEMTYKEIINERDVLDHTTLNVTLKELISRQKPELGNEIQRILSNNIIEKPDHQKPYDTSTNYYKVDLTAEQVNIITQIFLELEVNYVNEDGEKTPTGIFYASLTDKWNKLAG
ncbi:MAG: hypothetical protein H0V30_02225 [Chitinophagaceae bacterium]|jgi:uncharacterized protein YpuA (DUF1002 family)|nr:hypothetical protein [Chitinophagaceae bacterium]